jgi:hypothetical protein
VESTTYRAFIPLFTERRGEWVLMRPYREDDARRVFAGSAKSRQHLQVRETFASAHQTVEESWRRRQGQMAEWFIWKEISAGFWERASGRYPRDRTAGFFGERNERSAAIPGCPGCVQQGRTRHDSLTPADQMLQRLMDTR